MSRVSLLVALVPFLAAAPLTAQTELGLDAGVVIVDYDGGGNNLTTIAFPRQNVRFGFWMSELTTLELQTSLVRQSQGGNAVTQFGLEGAARYRLGEWDWDASVPFLRGGVGLTHRSVSDVDSDTQLHITLGGGVDFPLTDPLAFRLEGRYEHRFESDRMVAANVFAILVGLTVVLD